MRAIGNWSEVKAAEERPALPAGGYICKILDARVVEYQGQTGSFEKLEISLDIVDGEYKDFYANDYRAQQMEDKKWKGMLRQYLPKEDGSEKDEWTKSSLKALINAVEDSNDGYHWDWKEEGLKGKQVGCLFRSEEWEFDGRSGWATRPFKFVPSKMIQTGKFKIPSNKPLKNKAEVRLNTAAANVEVLDDLPF